MNSLGQPTVSIVIPVHNDPEGLQRCLKALDGQSYPAHLVQIIVCDNASRVPLAPLSLHSAARLRLLHEPVPGSYRARNASLACAEGDVIAFTDADCTPDPDWLLRGVAALDRGVDMIAGEVAVYSESSRPSPLEIFEMVSAFPQKKYVERLQFGVTANLLVRAQVFGRVGPFNAELTSGGDREFCNRAVKAGLTIDYCKDAVVRHPARSTVRQVWSKAVRVRRGTYREGPAALPLRTWLRRVVPPLGAIRRARDPRVPAGAGGRYVLGEMLAHYIGLAADSPYVFSKPGSPRA